MQNKMILITAWRNISRNRKRSALTVTAIGLAVMLICFMKSYVDGLMGNMEKNIFVYETGHIKIQDRDYEKEQKLMPLDLAVRGFGSGYTEVTDLVRNLPGVTAVLPRTRFGVMFERDGKLKNAMGLALDFRAEKPVMDLEAQLVEGRLFRDWAPGVQEIVLGRGLAAEIGLKPGDRITMMTKTAEEGLGHMTFTVSGIVSAGIAAIDKAFFYLPLSTAEKFLRMEGEVTEILVMLRDKDLGRRTAEEINALLAKQEENPYQALSWDRQNDGQYFGIIGMGAKMYSLVYFVFMLLASLVIINTTMMVVLERMKEIGTIAAMGMRGGDIVRLFFYEALILSVIGSFFGTMAGGGFAFWLSRAGIDFAKMTGGGIDLQMSEMIYTVFNAPLLIWSFVFGVAVASVCSWFPARRAARIDPVEAMRGVL